MPLVLRRSKKSGNVKMYLPGSRVQSSSTLRLFNGAGERIGVARASKEKVNAGLVKLEAIEGTQPLIGQQIGGGENGSYFYCEDGYGSGLYGQIEITTGHSAVNFYFRALQSCAALCSPCVGPNTNSSVSGSGWDRLAEVIGFSPGANLWPSDYGVPAQTFVTPYSYNFEPPPYILLVCSTGHMSANVVSRSGEDLKGAGLMGKIVLYPPFKLERQYPIQLSGTGLGAVTSLTFTFLNPWHSPYRFNGRNWSMTLMITSPRKAAFAECFAQP